MSDPQPTATGSPLYEAIGRLAVSWALLEAALDFSVVTLHTDLGGNAAAAKKMPRHLSQKLDYIDDCFRNLDPLKSAAPNVTNLTSKIRMASELRHDIIHGIACESPEGAKQIAMIRLLRGDDAYIEKSFNVSVAEIRAAADEADALTATSQQLAHWLLDKTPDPRDDAGALDAQ